MLNGILQKNEIINRSKPVTDIKKEVTPFIKNIVDLCNKKIGEFNGALALAHCQVEKDNPLTFFVFNTGETIINPEILELIGEKTTSMEGCLSLALRPEKKVKRYEKIKVKYLDTNGKERVTYEYGKRAYVFQHETDHFKNKYIY